jgi:muramidase (phage lysozyme)
VQGVGSKDGGGACVVVVTELAPDVGEAGAAVVGVTTGGGTVSRLVFGGGLVGDLSELPNTVVNISWAAGWSVKSTSPHGET